MTQLTDEQKAALDEIARINVESTLALQEVKKKFAQAGDAASFSMEKEENRWTVAHYLAKKILEDPRYLAPLSETQLASSYYAAFSTALDKREEKGK